MKHQNYPLSAICIISLFLFSLVTGCKKSNDTVNLPDFSATIGSAAFQTRTTGNVFDQTYQYFRLMGYMPGPDQDSLYLEVYLPATFVVNHPIDISVGLDAGLSYYDLKGLQDFAASANLGGHGTITVTSWDAVNHKIAGTFSGEMLSTTSTDTLEITNGHFNTVYALQP